MPVDSTNIGESHPRADEVIAQDGDLEITGGNVSVPDGDVDVENNALRGLDAKLNLKNAGLDLVSRTSGTSPLRAINSSGTVVANAKDGGNLEIPSGNLNVPSGSIRGDTNIEVAKNGTKYGRLFTDTNVVDIRTDQSGVPVRIWDNVNGKVLLSAKQSGNVEIPSGKTIHSGHVILSDSGTDDSYDLEFAQSNSANPRVHAYNNHLNLSTDDGTGTLTDVIRARTGGNAQLPTGDLIDGSGNAIYDQSRGVVPEARLTPNAKDVHDSGDYILVDHVSVGDNSNHSHANSTYSNANTGALNALRVPRGSVTEKLPTDSTGSTYVSTRLSVNPGSDQIDVRLYDDANATVVHETTGITGGWQGVELGPTLYDWTGDARFLVQTRNSDGATTVYANLNIDVNIYGAK